MSGTSTGDDRSFRNKYGYFSEDGYEYIITRPDTPRPWTNIVCNGDFGFIVSQAGGGFTWRTHVNLNRLTRWSQDLIRDDWGKWLYLQDLDSGEFRSLAFQPVQANYDHYQVRHGLGYTTFSQSASALETEWTMFVAKGHPVEIWLCTLKNLGPIPRRLRLASYLEWNLGAAPDNHREFHKLFIETRYHDAHQAISAAKCLWEVPTDKGHWNTDWPFLAFHSLSEPVAGWDTSKDNLIGRHGSFSHPKGIRLGKFSQTAGRFQDAAAALATEIGLEPQEEKTIVFLLGQVDNKEPGAADHEMRTLIAEFSDPKTATAELRNVHNFWKELTNRVHLETPDPAFDLLSNVWLKYQSICGHMWARTGYYQQSGAYGFRDQLQTSQVWLPLEPERMLDHVRLNARHQFQAGTVLHWWHPLTEQGLSTDMTDDLLWLPFLLPRYFNETGDVSTLSEILPFYDEGKATLQDHCTKAIDIVLSRFSGRGLPLIGAGDWCDGFSAVGLEWKGESIWLGMFLYDILQKWSEILAHHSPIKNEQIAKTYLSRAEALKEALNTHGWNGQWYSAATTDEGQPIGDPSQDDCNIYLNSQTWAIISGIANAERREKIIKAMLEHLECDSGLMLFHPAFQKPNRNIGYVTRYAPGLRENGGIYTHAASWGVLALARQGRAADAMRIFRKLNSIVQSKENPDKYQAEPYVLPGNIDGDDSDYPGRAGWTWYTGSAGWLFTIAHEAICGVQPVFEGLKIDPCIPPEWPRIQVSRRFRGATYEIAIENPQGLSGGVKEMEIDGKKILGNVASPLAAGKHVVKIVLSGAS